MMEDTKSRCHVPGQRLPIYVVIDRDGNIVGIESANEDAN